MLLCRYIKYKIKFNYRHNLQLHVGDFQSLMCLLKSSILSRFLSFFGTICLLYLIEDLPNLHLPFHISYVCVFCLFDCGQYLNCDTI